MEAPVLKLLRWMRREHPPVTEGKPTSDWERDKHIFEWEGMLLDVVVLDVGPTDWARFLEFVRGAELEPTYTEEGKSAPMPKDARPDIDASPVLALRLRSIVLHCLFHLDDQIELTFDPREINSEADYLVLIGFMKSLARALGRKVGIYGEVIRQEPFVSVDPLLEPDAATGP